MGNTCNQVSIRCCKYGENRYCERYANEKWCASKYTGLLNSCLRKWYLIPYLVVPLISARVPLISARVSVHCQAILLQQGEVLLNLGIILCICPANNRPRYIVKSSLSGWTHTQNDTRDYDQKVISEMGLGQYAHRTTICACFTGVYHPLDAFYCLQLIL